MFGQGMAERNTAEQNTFRGNAPVNRTVVDCDSCSGAGSRCGSCVVGFFLDHSSVAPLDHREAAAVSMLMELGMVAPEEARGAHAVRESLHLVS